jgi:NADH-quinone oxidoreductase subunit L
MLQQFIQQPGQLYVVATLLPLASFLLLLLAGGLRAAVRPYRETSGACRGIFQLLGGDVPRKTGAYVATVAIGLACVLCAIGFVMHARDGATRHHLEEELDHEKGAHGHAESGGKKELEAKIAKIDARWASRVEWARIGWLKDDSRPATTLELGFRIDYLSATMFLMVTFIATLIHVFSIGYMRDELEPNAVDHQVHTEHGHLHRRGRFGRFFMFLSLFCFSMLNLMLADNLFQVFVSWELVGVCSYLLIGFYFERQSASNAANKAFITNRVGDAGFIIGLLILWTYVGSFNFEDIFKRVRAPLRDTHGERVNNAGQLVRGQVGKAEDGSMTVRITPTGDQAVLFPIITPKHFHHDDYIDNADLGVNEEVAQPPKKGQFGWMPYWLLVAAGLGIFLGCVGKSAQFPLQVWLPDAMEGPTPVSALIHAATMVAAGVYLVGRVYPLFTPEARLVIAYTGGITLFVAATIAIVMTDIKKVLAYSTVSQLGYMMLALGVGGWAAGLFHLITHAFFKALLFLGSGAVIYGCHHEQEMTKMGGLRRKMPITAYTMLIGVLTIGGLPFFAGWYSKDAIVANAFGFAYVHSEHMLLFLLPLMTAGITAFYMFRMWFMTFVGPPRDHHVHEHAHEPPAVMTVPLILLAICSIAVAWGWPIYDAEASFLEHHLHHSAHYSLSADFGSEAEIVKDLNVSEHHWTAVYHSTAGTMALGAGILGFIFASLIYWFRKLDPADAAAQFPGVYQFLQRKWYFDEAYSVLLVRPALAVASWCRAFDTKVIDGVADGSAKVTVEASRWNGKFDLGIIDGIANLLADVTQAVGGWLRRVQTGYLRSYVLFLALAVIGIYALLAYFASLASAGP